MRKMDIAIGNISDNKKIRGLKRKCQTMVKNIEEQTRFFPEIIGNCWHEHAPVSQSFIDGRKTKISVKRLFIQTYVNQVQHLIKNKPQSDIPLRVIVFINTAYLFNTQIDVFFGNEYYHGFFDRNDDYQRWIPLSEDRSIIREFNLSVPNSLKVKGYKEIIKDDDSVFESEFWAIGEL